MRVRFNPLLIASIVSPLLLLSGVSRAQEPATPPQPAPVEKPAQDPAQPPVPPPVEPGQDPTKPVPLKQDPVKPAQDPAVEPPVVPIPIPTPKPKAKPAPKPVPVPEPPAMVGTVDGITFDVGLYGPGTGKGKTVYVPARQAADALGWNIIQDKGGKTLMNGKPLTVASARRLFSGSWVIPVRELQKYGASVDYDGATGLVTVSSKKRSFDVQVGEKRVEVDISKQKLTAYQGETVVMETNVSTGRTGNTPRGEFTTTRYKTPMHFSSLYNNSPMPWSVQIVGDIFFHGYSSVPSYPASHGCVRMPLTGQNAARWLYHWISPGTPVKISGRWAGRR